MDSQVAINGHLVKEDHNSASKSVLSKAKVEKVRSQNLESIVRPIAQASKKDGIANIMAGQSANWRQNGGPLLQSTSVGK